MCQSRQQLIRAIVMHHDLADQPPEPHHALPEPRRHSTAM
jgi:hypothetical protein